MPNHDGTGPSKGCCKEEKKQEGGCGCGGQHRHGEGEGCCHKGEQHRHHGEHGMSAGYCRKHEEK